MIIKGLTDEDFVNYKIPSMFIATARCTGKCNMDCGMDVCQNTGLMQMPDIEVSAQGIVERYMDNKITQAIIFSGLDPLDQPDELLRMVACFRENGVQDDIVIYTGYTREESADMLRALMKYRNIVVKFGRYVPGQEPHFDPVLGVRLASDNQYAERIS